MTSLPHRNLSRAVLIGTSDYECSDRLPSLPAVRQNLTDLTNALTDPDTGIVDWDRCVLIDTPDSPASFMGRLRKAASQAEDLLLVYYAGHGVRHDKRDDLYLTVRETDPDGLDGTAVPFAWVRDAIEHSPARTRLLILDCCYSGMALGSMSSGTIDPREVQISGTSVITSSPKNKISHSPPGERLTAFTGELISLLTHGPRIAGEPLTVHNLYRGLVAAMANRQLPEPKMKASDLSADLLLRRSSTHRERPAPVPPAPAPPRQSTPPVLPPPPPPRVHRPQARPEPTPAAAEMPTRTPAKSTSPVARVASSTGRLLLWIAFALFLDMALGGAVGSMFGTPPTGTGSSDDLQMALIMAAIAAACVVIIWRVTVLRSSAGRRVTIAGNLRDTLEASLVKVPTTILATLAILFLIFTITGLFAAGDQPLPGQTLSTWPSPWR